MKVGRENLELKLIGVIQEYDSNKKVIDKIKNAFTSKGFSIARFNNLMNQKTPLPAASIEELYYMTKSFFTIAEAKELNPEKYFNELEIEEAEKYIVPKESESKYPKIFKSVKKIYDDFYTTSLTAQEVSELFNKQLVTYNEETQRNPRVKKVNDKLIMEAYINPNSVNEIKQDLLNNKFITNTITINLLQDGNDEFAYDEEDEEFVVKSGQLNIVDGMHRSVAMMKAISDNPYLEYITSVNLTNFDVGKARRYIVQEDKKNKINKKYIKSIDEDNFESFVVRKLNETGSLSGKIATNQKVISYNRAYVLFDTLADAIKYNFNITNKREAREIAEYLSEGFDEIISFYGDEFNKNIVMSCNNMFAGYVAILKHLQNNKNWVKELENILSSIDFSGNNSHWNEIGILNKNTGLSTIKKISNYFNSILTV